ncbi:lycopene cyclase domain-containing protein [Seonamhaeicola marinus]|uniref:Lycopene cyclase domain-containing protein n=1 Tax=Seonamhaeicola marinus TaxID=1912246 RepID=A0A5D0H407_9FLAO|nr:lycopene cyclase domain-containing protein [Seonamhaeicola marinus]TYA65955.1 lycopene cyclase domain-containing protein [Seonamhaeicola marinus]
MNYLYLILNLGSLSIPFLFSFHPKLKFYTLWKPLFIGILLSMFIFIPWDIVFTYKGFWGFNGNYLIGTSIFNLPLEEWLFFICIPYACVFTHYALLHYFPNLGISKKLTKLISYILMLVFSILIIYNYDKWYTLINFTLALVLIFVTVKYRIQILSKFYITFLVMLIPFFVVNGVLTGSFIKNEVVWYNNAENLNFRLFTIPVEDSIYAFSLILIPLFIIEHFNSKTKI